MGKPTTFIDLHKIAMADVAPGGRYGVARHALADGSTLFYCVDKAAKSVKLSHKPADADDSDEITRERATELLAAPSEAR